MIRTQIQPLGLCGAAVFVALAGSTACTTYRAAPPSTIAPEREIRVRFSSPVALVLACDSSSATDSTAGTESRCPSDSQVVPGVVELSGRFERADGDSVLVRIAELRDSLNNAQHYNPRRSVWLHGQMAVIDERHTSATRTILLVVAITAAVAAVIAVAQASSTGWDGPSGPKPGPGPKFF